MVLRASSASKYTLMTLYLSSSLARSVVSEAMSVPSAAASMRASFLPPV